jgi:hypothetical protein
MGAHDWQTDVERVVCACGVFDASIEVVEGGDERVPIIGIL